MNAQWKHAWRAGPALLVAVMLAPPASASGALRADGDQSYENPAVGNAATLAVEGTVETTVSEGFGDHSGATYAYSVRTDEGDAIPLPPSFGKTVPNGGEFKGELALTGELVDDLRDEGVDVAPGETIDADSVEGETAVAVASDAQSPVPVANATVTEPALSAPTPSAHHLYVAVPTNRGAVVSTTAAIASIRSYWVTESSGAISSFDVAATARYASTVSASDNCGLAGGHNAVWDEAASKFPGVDFETEGNHLMVVVPDACSGSAGVGTVGSSINDGGRSIVSASAGLVQIGSHELGHNFGLGHANAEQCSSACSTASYYDVFSLMGFAVNDFAPPALPTAARRFLRLSDGVAELTAPGATVVQLKPRSDSSGQRGLRIVDPLTKSEYFVEYRSGAGRDAATYYAQGGGLSTFRYAPGIVITQYTTQSPGRQTKVLTRRVGTSDIAYLSNGGSFATTDEGVRVTVSGLSSTSAAVSVQLASEEVAAAGPVPSANPTISHLPRVLQPVSAVTTGWAPGTTFTYQWKVNGVAVPGATTATYKPAIADYNKNLSVSVTGSKTGYLKQTRTSVNSTQTKVYAGILGAATPTITGTATVGSTLRVIPGAWTYGTKLTYRWYANNVAISGATATSYKITSNRRGAVITVKVTGSKYPFLATTKTSLPTAGVK